MPDRIPSLLSLSPYSRAVAADMYPGQLGQDDQQDAARHMLAAGTLARKYGPGVAEFMGKAHEWSESPLKALMMAIGAGQMPKDYQQDLHNNALGIELARRARSQRELEDLVQQAAERATKQRTPGQPWVYKAAGGAVRSAAAEALAKLKLLRDEAAAREAFMARQRAAQEALYTRDIQPLRSPTDEELQQELQRKARGGLAQVKECSCHG